MTDRNISDLCPALQILCQKWIVACSAAGLKVGISQTYRSDAEQDADYAQGRTTPGKIITNAKAGQSAHNCTLADGTPAAQAFDFMIYNDDETTLDWNPQDAKWQKAIAIGINLGLISGSSWHSIKDYPHFEMPNWQTI